MEDEEKTQEQEQIDNKEELPEEESTEELPAEDAEEPEDQGDEQPDDLDDGVDFDEWKREQGLPDGITSPEQLATSYKELFAEMKRNQMSAHDKQEVDNIVRKMGFAGYDDFITAGRNYQPAGQQRQQQEPSYWGLVNNLIQQGQLPENILSDEYYTPIHRIMDQMFRSMVGGYGYLDNQIGTGLAQTRQQLQDENSLYAFLATNPGYREKRKELEALKRRHGFDSWEETALWLNMRDPEFANKRLAEEHNRAEKRRLKTFGKRAHGRKRSQLPSYMVNGVLDQDRLAMDRANGKITEDQFERIVNDSIGG